ncbi:uncharacterized protein PG998_014599 [Apiospora kogelbergensis]|uniref:uncharacterized protein n=1 Tax=Apiospora kogelbergensis TaxID=1337665 RepID=UPI00312D0E36
MPTPSLLVRYANGFILASPSTPLAMKVYSGRCLDIGENANYGAHLVDVGTDTPYPRYITLSYRWTAETKRTSLRVENTEQFYISIPDNDWPQIYKDAVSIAYQLGVRYIWIDSLCIVQDNEEDWVEQASQMDQIYSNGALNLAGVEAQRETGLIFERIPLRVAPCVLTQSTVEADTSSESWICYRPDDVRKAVDRAPLYGRGWTYQERMLSKRTVHFADQVFWECGCLHASEAFPLGTDDPLHPEVLDDAPLRVKTELKSGIPSTEGGPVQASNPQWRLGNSSQSPEPPNLHRLHRIWCSIVRCYSPTRLTHAADRLFALKGISKVLARSYGLSANDYLTGLWKPCLAQQLLWSRESDTYTPEDEVIASDLQSYFPSWSWACCPGETRFVYCFYGFLQTFITLDGDDNVSNEDARSPIPTHLTIRGRLIARQEIQHQFSSARGRQAFIVTFKLDEEVNDAPVEIHVEMDRPVRDQESQVEILPVMSEMGHLCGLVLIPQGLKGGSQVYKRAGIFHCEAKALERFLCVDMGITEKLEDVLDASAPFFLL